MDDGCRITLADNLANSIKSVNKKETMKQKERYIQ